MVARHFRGALSLIAFLAAGLGLGALFPLPDGSHLLPVWLSVTMIAIGAPTLFIVSNFFDQR